MKKCRLCGKDVKSQRGLTKHLEGSKECHGHEMPRRDAIREAEDVFDEWSSPMTNSQPKQVSIPPFPPEVLADPYASFLIQYFTTLVAHKKLPKYQFERRVDAIISMFLPGILKQLRGWQVELVVPEFPLKKPENNQSTNADHLLFRQANGPESQEAWILFELKTDSASVRDDQLGTYLSALDRGMPQLLADVETIAAASNARAKYAELRTRVAHLPEDRPVELVYLSPCHVDIPAGRGLALTFKELDNVSLPEFPAVWDLFRRIVLPNMGE
ncbi:MAG: hypothetical protein WCK05_02760 [Planctomycetota bacterium]